MTIKNSIALTERLQDIDSLAHVLLSMTQCYKLPESVNIVIDELNTKTETLNRYSIKETINS